MSCASASRGCRGTDVNSDRVGREARREGVAVEDATWVGREKHNVAIKGGEDVYDKNTLTVGG